MTNNIHNYNDLIYKSRPVKFDEYMNNKYNKIHNQLYLDALNKFLQDEDILSYKQFNEGEGFKSLEDIKENTKIIELKNLEFWQPSSILVISKKYPFTQVKYDLEKYWNKFQDKSNKQINNIKLIQDEILDAEIIYLNYISGKATVESRLNDIKFDVDFEYIDNKTKIGDDYSLKDTFTNKYYK